MDFKFKRDRDERILLEGTGACLLKTNPSLADRLTAGHIMSCKLFLTNKRIVGAQARDWAQSRNALVILMLPIVYGFTLLTPRNMIFSIPIGELSSCVYWKKKGRFIFKSASGQLHTVVSHAFHRNHQARKLFAGIAELNPNASCSVVEGKELPAEFAEA
jgi:hypothetical protein